MWPCEFVSISAYNLIYFCLYFSGKPQVTRVYSRNAILHHSDAWERVPINPPRSPGNLISVPVLVMQFLMQSLEKTSPVRLVEWGERERERDPCSEVSHTPTLWPVLPRETRQGWGGCGLLDTAGQLVHWKTRWKLSGGDCGDWRCEGTEDVTLTLILPLQLHWNMCEITGKHAANMSSLCRECLEEGSLC